MAAIAAEGAPLLRSPFAGQNLRQMRLERLARDHPVLPEWTRGPLHDRQRRITDKPFLALFVLCLLTLFATSAWAFKTSTEKAFDRPRDSSGNFCGQGQAKDYPFLYLQTFTAPYKSVCVKACPSFNYAHLLAKDAAGKKTASAKPVGFDQFARKYAGNTYTKSEVLTESEAFDYPQDWAKGKFTQEQWAEYLKGFSVDCLPNKEFSSCRYGPEFSVYDSYAAVRKVCVPLSPKAALLFNKVAARFDLGLAEDFRLSYPILLRTVGFAVVLGTALLGASLLLPRLATVLTTGLAITGLAGMAAVILHGVFFPGPLNNTVNPLRVKYLQFWLDNKLTLLPMAGLGLAVSSLLGLRLIRLSSYIGTPSHMIHLAGRQTLRTPLSIILTMLTLATQIFALLGGLCVLAKLCTTGKAPVYAKEAPFAMMKQCFALKVIVFLYSNGLFWVVGTLSKLNDFCIEALAADNYFNVAIDPFHVLCHTLGHHVGSLALLAALTPIVRLREALITLGAVLPASLKNKAQQSALSRVYDRWIGGVCPRSLVGIYIGSIDFYRAANTIYPREKLFSAQIGPLLSAGDLLSGTTQIAGASLTAVASYLLYKSSIVYQQNINCICLLWSFGMGIGFFVSTVLPNICCRTLDSTYGCYLLQLELNRQGYNFAGGPRELQEALAELGAATRGLSRPLT